MNNTYSKIDCIPVCYVHPVTGGDGKYTVTLPADFDGIVSVPRICFAAKDTEVVIPDSLVYLGINPTNGVSALYARKGFNLWKWRLVADLHYRSVVLCDFLIFECGMGDREIGTIPSWSDLYPVRWLTGRKREPGKSYVSSFKRPKLTLEDVTRILRKAFTAKSFLHDCP